MTTRAGGPGGSEPILTIEEVLQSIAADGSWVFFFPMTVHPEYRVSVWELVQSIGNKSPEERRETWKRRSEDWQRLCRQEP